MGVKLRSEKEIRTALNDRFNVAEIDAMLRDLEVDIENFGGKQTGKTSLAIAVTTFFERRHRVVDLQNAISLARPSLGWGIIGEPVTHTIEVTEVPTSVERPQAPVTHPKLILRQVRERLVELESLIDKLDDYLED